MYKEQGNAAAATHIAQWLSNQAGPSDIGLLIQLAWILLSTGQSVASSQVAEKVAATATTTSDATLVILAISYMMLGKKNKVQQWLGQLESSNQRLAKLLTATN
jgi:hypothetical protein